MSYIGKETDARLLVRAWMSAEALDDQLLIDDIIDNSIIPTMLDEDLSWSFVFAMRDMIKSLAIGFASVLDTTAINIIELDALVSMGVIADAEKEDEDE